MASLGQQINKKQEFCLLVAVIQLISSSDADSKESALSVGDLSSIPGSGGSPGDDNGNPLQYSCLENSMDRGAWQATVHAVKKSRTRLTNTSHLTSIYVLTA